MAVLMTSFLASGVRVEGHLLTPQLYAWRDVTADSYEPLTESPGQPRMTLTSWHGLW